eukprot:CAMPEP_0183291100 /NCGR_PEP_ID=MMETSP0160_2-20130417/636_1 /TAXON_ID=2839 ORGANISM="Odontella Sinensis, Strain Grunow 1884" /NCGR_SAMPLE_ID=MMETSP0160_2 /ASSEMBLY_ACC=CAM_ASM_000250 /LENGTH=274 /DNA_ID=CAMNT_0025451855 /DNA_START=360 /DNA_END=1184 /DNA_ORIENTATION=+
MIQRYVMALFYFSTHGRQWLGLKPSLAASVHCSYYSSSCWHDFEGIEMERKGADVLMQNIPSEGSSHVDGKVMCIGIRDASEKRKLRILSQLDCGNDEEDESEHMLLLHFEQNGDKSTEISAELGAFKLMLSRQMLDKARDFFVIKSKSTGATGGVGTPSPCSVIKLKSSTCQIVLAEQSGGDCDRLFFQGKFDAEITARRDVATNRAEGTDLHANWSSVSFYKAEGHEIANLVHILEPTNISLVASSTFTETSTCTKISSDASDSALNPQKNF